MNKIVISDSHFEEVKYVGNHPMFKNIPCFQTAGIKIQYWHNEDVRFFIEGYEINVNEIIFKKVLHQINKLGYNIDYIDYIDKL